MIDFDPDIPLEEYYNFAEKEYFGNLALCKNDDERRSLTRRFAYLVKLLGGICEEFFGKDYFYSEMNFKSKELFLLAEDFISIPNAMENSIHWKFYDP